MAKTGNERSEEPSESKKRSDILGVFGRGPRVNDIDPRRVCADIGTASNEATEGDLRDEKLALGEATAEVVGIQVMKDTFKVDEMLIKRF